MHLNVILAILIACCSTTFSADQSCGVVKRKDWNAQPATEVEYMIRPVCIVIIQHTVTPECNTNKECKQIVWNIQNNHLNIFNDIGPSFLVGSDGNVYEGTGWSKVGAHTYGYNTRSIGITFIGDFTKKNPPEKAINAAKDLIKCGVEMGHISKNYKLFGHRQLVAVESPGNTFFRDVKTWEHWSSDVDSVKNKNTHKCQ